jgi:hypothetical protein
LNQKEVPISPQFFGKVTNIRNFKQVENFTWDHKNNAIDFSSCGKEFNDIFKNSGITAKDVNDPSTSLVVLDALIKFKKMKKANTSPKKNRNRSKEINKKRQLKDTIIRETISKQLTRRFKALVKGKRDNTSKETETVGSHEILSKSGIAWSEDSFKYSNRLAN